MIAYFFWIAVVNVLAFILFRNDKKRAQCNDYRIPELVLLEVSALGGALGAGMAMLLFHHKTQKQKFTILVPLFLLVHVVVMVAVLLKRVA